MRVLILGGTSEASALARTLASRRDIAPVLSLAGRTDRPTPPPVPFRIGGFGGIAGLTAYLARERIDAVVDATHPFAERMSANAKAACGTAQVPIVAFSRPPWRPVDGDRWINVGDADAAAAALGGVPRRVFLTVGRLSLEAFATATWHTYVVRTIDAPADIKRLPLHRLIQARGPFALADEAALLRGEAIEVVVSKNSGGEATYAKIAAARDIGIPVVMIRRPPDSGIMTVDGVEAVLTWLADHGGRP